MKPRIDLNCDLGESYGSYRIGNDEKVMPYISSANLACGFHGGDPITIAQTVELAKKHKVAVGAHPSFPDLVGFGRREMKLTFEEAKEYAVYQIGAVQGFARAAGMKLQHVKPHGALYNMAARDETLSKAIAEATHLFSEDLIVFAPPRSILAQTASKIGLRVAYEFFADRNYNVDGSLVSRKEKDAIIQEPREAVRRTIRALTKGFVAATDGKDFQIGEIHTVCLHGDTLEAASFARSLSEGLQRAGATIAPVGSFI